MGRKEETIICDTFRILSLLWIMEGRMLKAPYSVISQESPLRKGHQGNFEESEGIWDRVKGSSGNGRRGAWEHLAARRLASTGAVIVALL